MIMTDTVKQSVFQEVRRDRDYWRAQAHKFKLEIENLEMRLTAANRALVDAQRDAARKRELDRIFG